MSTAIAKNFQVGTSGTATDNFTIRQPATPDGTVRIANGNSGTTTDLVTLTSAGNLGVGTTAPTFRLVSANSGTDGGWLYSSGAVSILGLGGYANSSDGAFQIRYDRATGSTTFNGGSRDTPSERIRIDNTGNVGVGTSSPGTRLQVAGDVSAVNGRFRGNTTGTTILNNNTISVDGGFGGLLIIGCGDGSSAHFYCPYSTGTSLIRSDTVSIPFSTTDSGTALRVYKSSNSTTVTIKNSTGGTVILYAAIYTGF